MRARLAISIAALICALAAAAPADAATYNVTACAAGGGNGINNSWANFSEGGVSVPYGSGCWPGRGLANDINQNAAASAGDGVRLTAPAGAALSALTVTYQGSWTGGTWGGQIDDSQTVLWCATFSGYPCGVYPPAPGWWGFYGPATIHLTGSWQTLRLDGFCHSIGGCQGDLQTAWRDVAVTVSKTTGPALALTGGSLLSAAPLAGSQTLAWKASDTTGIRRVRLLVDGAVAGEQVESCDYTYVAPCPNASGSFTLDTTKLPDGKHTFTVEARDATDANAATQSGSFEVANAVPAPPRISPPAATNGWLDGAQATTYSPQLDDSAGIAGYAITTDGTTPGTTATLAAAADGSATLSAPAGGWPEGTDTIEARAISSSGVASPATTLAIRVDRTPPSIAAEGYGNPAPAWQPPPVSVRLVARDELSGVGAADDGAPVTGGGYIAYTVDAGPRQTAAGGVASITISEQGQHWLTFQAYDVAGNVSQSRTIYVNVGSPATGTPPGAGFWARTVNPASRFTAARAFGTTCPAAVTLTPSHDTYVDQAEPEQPHGSATTLVVRSGANANARSLLDFSLPPAGGCAVTSATLRLYSTASTSGRTLEVLRAGSAWTDAAATWGTRPGPTGAAATLVTTAGGWQSADVTGEIEDIYAYGDDGLIVRDATEGAEPAAGQSFGSSEAAAAEQPELVVTFG
jgi:hypothetical protein